MKEPSYWNHNTAYYRRIRKWTAGCASILDVGCGDGSLIAYLDDGVRRLTGIDVDESCVSRAIRENGGTANIGFVRGDFCDYDTDDRYDAIVFVASIHHMDMTDALTKAKALLAEHGTIIIVGLAEPSNVLDHVVEILRVLPCGIISALRGMRSSEDLDIPVSYRLPSLRYVRDVASALLPRARMRYGLYYRFLLTWTKP